MVQWLAAMVEVGLKRPILHRKWQIACVIGFALFAISHAYPLRAETLAPNSDDEIIYFDGNHRIHVYDPNPTSPTLEVDWASPETGWGDIALGDVTGDGDLEIIAIRAEGSGGRLTVFDPVAQDSPTDQVQFYSDLPWAILYSVELPAAPRLIATGEFDLENETREIIYSYALDSEFDRFVILRATGEGAPGRDWEELSAFELEGRWTAMDTGNVHVDDAVDEVALVSFERGELGLFRVVPSLDQTFTNVNLEHRWTDVALGQYQIVTTDNVTDGDEIGAVRDADLPLASTWVFRFDGVNFIDAAFERISPSPNVVFFTRINTNADEELVVLRQVQQELGPRPRLVLRDGSTNDALTLREDLLDGDNEYKGADGGDIDGDGKGEIVVIRNNRIRIYPSPESTTTYQLVERFTNGSTVVVGNVDAAGLAATSRAEASETAISTLLSPGQVGSSQVISLWDATRGAQLPFTVELEGVQGWATVSPAVGSTPTEIAVQFSAEGVDPGEYAGELVVNFTSENVENSPLVIPLVLQVRSVVGATPPSVDFVYYPCEEPLAMRERDVVLSGTEGTAYSVQVEGNAEWVTVAPEAGTLPETVQVTVDPAQRPAEMATVDLLVTVDLPGQPGVVDRVPVFLACPDGQVHLPVVGR